MRDHPTQSARPLERARALLAMASEGGHELACLLVSIDRLQRHDDETREALQDAVEGLVLSEPGASTWRVLRQGHELLALCPRVGLAEVGALARALVDGARKLRVRAGERELRPRVSVGVAHTHKRPGIELEVLIDVARESLGVAQAAGGDRWVHTELYDLLMRRHRAGRPAAGETSPAEEPAVPLEELAAGLETLDPVEPAAVRPGQPVAAGASTVTAPAAPALPAAAAGASIGMVLGVAPGVQGAAPAHPVDPGEDVDVLERRIAKLLHALELAEGEIHRLRSQVGTEAGISSIYRTVQGLAPDEPLLEVKRALMAELYRANQALQRTAS